MAIQTGFTEKKSRDLANQGRLATAASLVDIALPESKGIGLLAKLPGGGILKASKDKLTKSTGKNSYITTDEYSKIQADSYAKEEILRKSAVDARNKAHNK